MIALLFVCALAFQAKAQCGGYGGYSNYGYYPNSYSYSSYYPGSSSYGG